MRANSIPDIKRDHAKNGRLKRSIFQFMWQSIAVLACCSFLLYLLLDRESGRDVFLWNLPLIVGFAFFASYKQDLFRRPDGTHVYLFEAANILTAVRIFLVLPVIILLNRGFVFWGLISYIVILLTDVADGLVARKWHQETAFGLMLDPFGDIASTLAVFSWLWVAGVVPNWLFIILVARYAEFFVGMIILNQIGKTPRLKATIAGKAAGVVQGLTIVILVAEKLNLDWIRADQLNQFLYVILALAFISVVLSQTLIGIDALRK